MYQSGDTSPLSMKMYIGRTDSHSAQPLHWQLKEEGQLSVDVVETQTDVVVISTLAGADSDNIEISLHNDLLTIRGRRPEPYVGESIQVFHKECFWGNFSRTIVLPVDVKADLARAEYKSGVLTIVIPKQKHSAKIPVTIVEE